MTYIVSVNKCLRITLIMILLLVLLTFPESQNSPLKSLNNYEPQWRTKRGSNNDSNPVSVNVSINVKSEKSNIRGNLIDELASALNFSNFEDFGVPTGCPNCTKLEVENAELREELKPNTPVLKPAYPCEEWDAKTRTCWLNRNIGDTVTFVLSFNADFNVQWKQEFHLLHSTATKDYIIDPSDPLWNVIIGSGGREMRLSPISEIDIDFNSFSACLLGTDSSSSTPPQKTTPMHIVNFRIRVRPIDHGFAYPGETMTLNMRDFNLPSTSIRFKWYLEKDGESGTLPSNMQLSPSGAVLVISELRKEQEGILTCAVYTNLGIFATKQRFLIKEIDQSNNMLIFMPTRPGTLGRQRRALDSEDDFEKTPHKNENTTPNADIEGSVEPSEPADSVDQSSTKVNNDDHVIDDETKPKNQEEQSENYREEDGVENTQQSKINEGDAEIEDDVRQEHPVSGTNQHPRKKSKHPSLMSSKNIQGKPNAPKNKKTMSKAHHKLLSHQTEQSSEQIILEVERNPDGSNTRVSDQFSRLIASCHMDRECSSDAACIQRNPKHPGFCRCTSGFQGSGIFCWEQIKSRNSFAFPGYGAGKID